MIQSVSGLNYCGCTNLFRNQACREGTTSIAFFVCPGSNLRHDFHGSINQLLQNQSPKGKILFSAYKISDYLPVTLSSIPLAPPSDHSLIRPVVQQKQFYMKKILFYFAVCLFIIACKDDKAKPDATVAANSDKPAVDLPYTASYSSSWNQDVSDADLKTVLMSYKDWADGNFANLAKGMGDTVVVDMSSGDHLVKSNADLMKMWTTYRDSLGSVKIDMVGWQKMHSTDKNSSFIVTWYDEYDTYKNGKVDSATYHDINQVKDGKIIWYAQYKRPKK